MLPGKSSYLGLVKWTKACTFPPIQEEGLLGGAASSFAMKEEKLENIDLWGPRMILVVLLRQNRYTT